ncbi:DPOM polymerase, partial [Acromyrmex heyeri]
KPHERVERELLEQCGQVATLVECFSWLQRCDECIEQLEELCHAKRPRLAIGYRQSAVARIARFAGAKLQLERRFMHVSGEYASGEYANGNERSFVWREIDAAFESRILTGAMINSNHIEPRQFLNDAGDVVLERVRDAVERHGSIKVNTAFNGEFAMKDKRANKSIITKNSEIYCCTDMREIEFPMTLKDIPKFERLNAVSINVYSIENRQVFSLRLTNDKKAKHVNLLQHSRNDNIRHFAWIKNLSRLVRSQITGNESRKYFCDRYLHYFSSCEKLQSHEVDCQKINDCAIRLPSEDDSWLDELDNYNNRERVPFIIYADLECVLRKTKTDKEDASSYAYQRCDELSSYHFCRDEDCIAWFARQINDLAYRVKNIVSANVPMETLSKQQSSATRCHICEKSFASDDTRVRDHCHLIGRYRGPAHSNLNYKNSFYIPVVFHNLSGYDAHFIIKEIATAYDGHVDILPITKEKYISFTKHVNSTKDTNEKLRKIKIDSFKFLNASLDKLASYFDKDKLKIVRSEFPTLSDEEFELLYLKTDVLLLADIFENFCSYLASYCLDPAHCYTLPGFTWDAMLKYTRIRFELLTDIDMVMFIERGIRGGFDPSKPSLYLIYYDVNNLYGWAMYQLLSYAEFQWFEDAANFDVSVIAPDSPTGYILEVNLEYPQHLHDRHTDLPFCPTRDKPPDKCENKVRNHVDVKLITKWYGYTISESKIALSPYDVKRYRSYCGGIGGYLCNTIYMYYMYYMQYILLLCTTIIIYTF